MYSVFAIDLLMSENQLVLWVLGSPTRHYANPTVPTVSLPGSIFLGMIG